MSGPPATRPRNFMEDWSAPATASPPTTVANPLQDLRPDARAFRPAPAGPRFREVAIEDLLGAPEVDDRHGGIDLSPDGGEVAFSWDRTGAGEIFVAPVRGERIYQLTDGSDRSVSPRWSPDGQWIAFLRDSGGDERFQIWLMRRDGRRLRQVTSAGDADHRDLAWSPDGSALAFVSDRTGERHGLEVVDVASGERRALSDFAYDHRAPQWSPDGRWLAVGSQRELSLIPAGGGQAIRLATRDAADGMSADARWSPDGRTIAFTTQERAHSDIALAHLEGTRVGRVEVLTSSIYPSMRPEWRPDGRGLAYLQARDHGVSVRRVFVASHADSPVADLPGVHASVRVGPDSETLAFTYASARRPADVWVRLQRAVAPQPVTTSLSPRVDPETLVEPARVRYPGGGGSPTPGLLFVPHAEAVRGDGLPPAVVRVGASGAGGPPRGWDPLAQWLAHRGYVVLVPDAGTDPADVVAGARWLEREAIAQPGRIAALRDGEPMALDELASPSGPSGALGERGAGGAGRRVEQARRATDWLDGHTGSR